ncbi:MAG: hypothetical protein AAFR61_19490 [Bacteroidota bacterium]
MDELLRKLQETNRKMGRLERVILKLKDEKAQLAETVGVLKSALADKDRALDQVEDRIEAAKLSQHLDTDDVARQAVKDKIDMYIKEIDECLKSFGE